MIMSGPLGASHLSCITLPPDAVPSSYRRLPMLLVPYLRSRGSGRGLSEGLHEVAVHATHGTNDDLHTIIHLQKEVAAQTPP